MRLLVLLVLNQLLDRWGFGNILQDDYAGSITEDYAILAGDFTAAAGYLAPEGGGTIVNDQVPSDVDQVTFSYLSELDPDDPDGDGDPDTGYGPDFYALFAMGALRGIRMRRSGRKKPVRRALSEMASWPHGSLSTAVQFKIFSRPGNAFGMRHTERVMLSANRCHGL